MSKTAAEYIKSNMRAGRVYRRQELEHLSSNLSRDLKKLLESEEIVKASEGLYYRPKMTRFGPEPANERELVRAFLNGGDFLLTSYNDYNPLGLGLTQLYNQRIVYNRKRHGDFLLDGVQFSFRRPRNFPSKLSKEFLYVEVLNNSKFLAEDTVQLEKRLKARVSEVDKSKLLKSARSFGKVRTRKFFEELLAA